MSGIVIVGAGECGTRAAFALREAGYDGPLRLIGEEAHLPYERPPLSKGHPVVAKTIADEARFAAADIALMRGARVGAIDRAARTLELCDGARLRYDRLLLAIGARPRVFPGMEQAATLRTLDDAEAILGRLGPGRRLAIVGGGFIGLELAATARGLGADVVVVEAAKRLMARIVPSAVAEVAYDRHKACEVEMILGAKVRSATAAAVELADGRRFAADCVVAGVGAVPNTSLAEKAGLPVDNGIVVDSAFRTADPAVFAAGDCVAFPYRGRLVRLESWRAAQDHGNHVARAMLGFEEPYARVPWFWSDQYDLTLQVAGLPDPSLGFVRRDLRDGAFILFQGDASGALVSASGIGPGNAVAKDIRLAEMLIGRGAAPDPSRLADPDVELKALLKAA